MYNAHPKLMYTAVYRACSFFTNLDLFCIDNARVIYRKIRYIKNQRDATWQHVIHQRLLLQFLVLLRLDAKNVRNM